MVQDHVHSLARLSRHRVHVLSFRGDLPASLEMEAFDAIVIHYSTFIYHDAFLSPAARARIAAYSGVKGIFLHDEYKHVDRTTAAMRALGIQVLFSCFPTASLPVVYGPDRLPGVEAINVLTGYVTKSLIEEPRGDPASQRPIDIGYRGRRYPAWHGALGLERVTIVERTAEEAGRFGLAVDLSIEERDRLYGRRWMEFLRSCKSVLGTESGSSVVDFTGEIAENVERHESLHPATPHQALRDLYFAEAEGAIPMGQISPRIFEAIACGAALILYEGEYSGVLRPGDHYFPLRKDHRNFAEAACFLRDGAAVDRMAERNVAEVLDNPLWQEGRLARVFDDAITRAAGRIARPRARGYGSAEFMRLFGRYDSVWRMPVLRRQAFRAAFDVYTTATRPLPAAVELRLRRSLKRVRAKLSGR